MIYRFDRFQADDDAFRLTADGSPVPLEPKTLRLLLYLIRHRGRLVRKQELLDAIWQDAAVTENALTRSIGLLRKALDDDSREPRFIETVPTAGYRFIAQVETIASQPAQISPSEPAAEAAPSAPPPAASVASSRRVFWRLAILAAGCLLLVGALSWLVSSRLQAAPSIHSLAVLPLNNLSGDPSQDYFAAGMTDELITQLARIPKLRVVSRTSVIAEKDAHLPLPEIARQLNVDAVVEGSIVRSGNRVRITAQLIDARTDHHLWAQSFEGSASDVLSLQDSVAQQIAQQARLVLLPSPPRPPVEPAAHDAYLRGLYFFNKQDFEHSVASFHQAVLLDPNYASAWAGYASALDAASTFGIAPPADLMSKAHAAAQRAIQLDPGNGEAYTALGSIQTIYDWNWAAAEQNLLRGISLNPNDPIAEFKYAMYLDAVGRPADAVAHMRRAVALDPVSFLMNRRLAVALYFARDYDAALAQLSRAAELENQPGSVDNYFSLIYEQKGNRDAAIDHDLAALHSDVPDLNVASLRSTYQQHGWGPYWRARRATTLSLPPEACTAYSVAIDSLRIHDLNAAFAAFNRAIDQHCFSVALIRVDPLLDTVRDGPRYKALLTRLHQ